MIEIFIVCYFLIGILFALYIRFEREGEAMYLWQLLSIILFWPGICVVYAIEFLASFKL